MIRDVLGRLARNEISIDEAEKMLKASAIDEIADIAKLDVGREIRKGFPEIILAEGKTTEDVVRIALGLLESKGRVIVSRGSGEQLEAITDVVPEGATLS